MTKTDKALSIFVNVMPKNNNHIEFIIHKLSNLIASLGVFGIYASLSISEIEEDEEEPYGEDTLGKISDALTAAEISDVGQRQRIITEMQNAGILFRERPHSPQEDKS